MKLEEKEVSSVRWVDLNVLMNPRKEQQKKVNWPMRFENFNWYYRILFSIFKIKNLYFPGILLPESEGQYDNLEDEYHLWGMTLGCTQRLIQNSIIEHNKKNGDNFKVFTELPFTTENSFIDWLSSLLHSVAHRSRL